MKKQNLKRFIGFNIEPAQYEKLKDNAFEAKITVSALIRKTLSEKFGGNNEEAKASA